MDRNGRHCIAIFVTTIIIGVALRCLYQLFPQTVLLFFAPQGSSVWELSKIGLWPSVLAVLLLHIGQRDKGSLCAYMLVPAAAPVVLLFIYWFLRMVCSIYSGLLDACIWVCLIAIGNLMALSIQKTAFAKQALFMVCMIVVVWIFTYTLFSIRPVDLPLFSPTIPQPAMSNMIC